MYNFIKPILIILIATLGISASFKNPGGENEIPERPYENSHFHVVDSLRIHYRIWNKDLLRPRGKVLLIHGFCGSTFCWRNNFDTLVKAQYQVYAIDLPGFGYSERSVEVNQSQSNRAQIIWKLLDTIDQGDTTRWNIVGHSMGGGTAEAVALTRPEKIRSLVLVSGMVFIKNDNVEKTVVGLVNHPLYKKLLLSYTEKNYLSFNKFRRELKGAYGFLPDSATVNGYLEPLLIDGTAETVVNLLANSDEIRPLNANGLKSLPVLLIWGKKDRTIRLATGKKLKRAVPSVELTVIPDAYHMPMETHPDVFNRILVDFLDQNN